MVRFFSLFIVLLAILFGVELLAPVQRVLVNPWTDLLASTSASLLSLFDHSVVSHARVLQSRANGFGVSIEAGCNGVEASLILAAAVLAFPSSWRLKLAGIGLGFLAVQIANLLRIISLFYLGQWNTQVFEFAHMYLWQALIMLDVLVVWMLWVAAVARSQSTPEHRLAV